MFNIRSSIAALAGLLLASSAPAMSAAEFLGKVDALKAKGPFALFSSDIGVLKKEGEVAVRGWYAQAKPPGQKPNACPPKQKIDIGQSEFLGYLQAVPSHQRASTSVTQAVTVALNRKYACPA